ncbi:hypothetical protein [Glaciecola sp. SC05]|uniref:hypothetical protein n=1 Tax=Glaciecola sp. SC05 TaxID=1987355 RepID=UPI0035288920
MKKTSALLIMVTLLAYFVYLMLLPAESSINTKFNGKAPSTPADFSEPPINMPLISAVPEQDNQAEAYTPAQCQRRTDNFNRQVADVNNVIVSALEKAIRQGKSKRALLGYQTQYKAFYAGFDDLLLRARINIERDRYRFVSSPNELRNWNGLSVIDLPSNFSIDMLVDTLLKFNELDSPSGIPLTLKDTINKQDVYALLDNNDNFHTYLESLVRLQISNVISPSILFVMSAQVLSAKEFTQAVYSRAFTVDDAAIGILQDLPIEYLAPLFANTQGLDAMPVFVQGIHDSFENLADLAAATHNTAALKTLANYGVMPSNEIGIITGMDIAIMNIAEDDIEGRDSARLNSRIIETLQYLKSRGYAAHGQRYERDGDINVLFKAPNRRQRQTIKIANLELRNLMHDIDLLDINSKVTDIPHKDSPVLIAIREAQSMRDAMQAKSDYCAKFAQ